MRKLIAFTMISLFSFLSMQAQNDSLISIFKENNDNTIYSGIHKIIDGNNSIAYIAFPALVQRKYASLRGENPKRFPYIFEANIPLDYDLVKGRAGSWKVKQSIKFQFFFNPTFRMVSDHNLSYFIVPSNYKFGFRGFYVLPILSNSCKKYNTICNINYDNFNWYNALTSLRIIYFNSNIGHFSNGQSGNANDSLKKGVNNYVNGNFSTNFFNFILNYIYYNGNSHQRFNRHFEFVGSIGYQKDATFLSGIFEYDPNQLRKYGKQRWLGTAQFRWTSYSIDKRKMNYLAPQNILRKSCEKDTTNAMHKEQNKCFDIKRDSLACKDYTLHRIYQHRIRIETSYISDDLQNFNADQQDINTPGKDGKDFRLSTHIYYQLTLPTWRSVSLLAHVFYGRDYLNIRYDDVALIGMVGISFQIPKYLPARFNNRNYITNL